MRIKYVGSSARIISKFYTTGKDLVLRPNIEYVLYDEDIEKNSTLVNLIKDATVLKISDEEPLEAATGIDADVSAGIDKLITWVQSSDVAIQFTDPINGGVENTYSGAVGVPVVVGLAVTNGSGVTDTFNSVATVVVTVDAGTINGGAGPVTVTFVNGVITVSINRINAGDVGISLSGGNTSLNKADIAKVTFA
jgi:hypothetical protein